MGRQRGRPDQQAGTHISQRRKGFYCQNERANRSNKDMNCPGGRSARVSLLRDRATPPVKRLSERTVSANACGVGEKRSLENK